MAHLDDYAYYHISSRVAWDEANLNFLEANKTPKRKITEPKTPYHPPEGALNNAEHAQAIWNALNEVASSSSGQCSSEGEDEGLGESSSHVCDSTGLGQSGHRLSFAEQRKAHYDEFRKSKSLRHEDLAVNDAEDDTAIDGTDSMGNHAQEMVIDGMGSVGIHDPASPSGSWQRNTYKQSSV